MVIDGDNVYCYTEWLDYMIKSFFIPWGIVLNGNVYTTGEMGEKGVIKVVNNKVTFEELEGDFDNALCSELVHNAILDHCKK